MWTTRSFTWQKFYSCTNLWRMRSFPQFPEHLMSRHLSVCVTVGQGICLRSSLFQLTMTNTEFTGKTVEAGLPHRTCISYFFLDVVWESFKNNFALHCDSIARIAFEKTAYKVYLISLIISTNPWPSCTGFDTAQQIEHFVIKFKSCALQIIQPAVARIASPTRWSLMVLLQHFSSCWLTVTIKDVFLSMHRVIYENLQHLFPFTTTKNDSPTALLFSPRGLVLVLWQCKTSKKKKSWHEEALAACFSSKKMSSCPSGISRHFQFVSFC